MHISICYTPAFFGLDFILHLLDTSSASCLCLSQRQSSLVMVQTVPVTHKIMNFLANFSEVTPQQQLLSSVRKKSVLSNLSRYFASKPHLSSSHTYSHSLDLQSSKSGVSWPMSELVIGKQEIRPKGVLSKSQEVRKDKSKLKMSALLQPWSP